MTDDWITAGDEFSFYRQMIDSVTDCAVFRLDQKGLVCSWHPGAQRLTQHTAEEIIGQPLAVLYPKDDGAGESVVDLATAAEAGRQETEGWRVRKDGDRFWASVVLTPIRDPDGSLLGYTMVARDLTGRREQDLALRSVEQMVDSITDYEVIRLDADGYIRSWNPGAQRLRQYTQDEVIGRHLAMFYPEEDRRAGLPEREMADAVRDGRVEREGWRVRKDGSRFGPTTSLARSATRLGSRSGS